MWRRRAHSPSTPKTILPLLIITIALTLILYKTKTAPKISPIESHPSVDRINGTYVISQIPASPKAVLFLAHGCGGRAHNFWDPSPSCPSCIGLPEERRIVLSALRRNFTVIAITSSQKCWTLGKEKYTISRIITNWIDKHGFNELPLTAMGASSGGYFVSALAAEMRFSSIAIMIAEGVFETFEITKNYPPTLFLHMPKDGVRDHVIKENMESLKKEGVDVKEIRCMEFPLTPEFLSDRIMGLDREMSVRLFDLFREEGFVDEKGYMRKDGRKTPWKEAAKRRGVLGEEFKLHRHIEEELNLAFGYHEMTSLQWDDVLDWFESHMS